MSWTGSRDNNSAQSHFVLDLYEMESDNHYKFCWAWGWFGTKKPGVILKVLRPSHSLEWSEEHKGESPASKEKLIQKARYIVLLPAQMTISWTNACNLNAIPRTFFGFRQGLFAMNYEIMAYLCYRWNNILVFPSEFKQAWRYERGKKIRCFFWFFSSFRAWGISETLNNLKRSLKFTVDGINDPSLSRSSYLYLHVSILALSPRV